MAGLFRGVVRGGVFSDIDNCAVVVSHPHPSNDFGGGPGPVSDWNQPWEDDAYSALVDDDFDPDDAYFEVTDHRHLAIRRDGAWSLHEIPEHGSIDWFDHRGVYRTVISYGGSATCCAELENGQWRTLTFSGLPPMAYGLRACRTDDDSLIISFHVDATSRAMLVKRAGTTFEAVEDLGETPGGARILATAGGTLVAAGDGLWARVNTKWTRLHSGEFTFLSGSPSGELLAGTAAGAFIVGTVDACRHLVTVGAIHSAVRFGEQFFVADEDRVYRVDADGFQTSLAPVSLGNWPATGQLSVGGSRLWLAGTHVIASTADGITWTMHDV